MAEANGGGRGAAGEALATAKRELSERYLGTSDRLAVRRFAAVSPAPTDNVVGVGIGEKLTEGRPTGEPAVKLFVRVKYERDQLDTDHVLPATHAGVATDVEEIGLIRPLVMPPATAGAPAKVNPRTRMRPAHPGCS